jgi:MFS family permease
MLSAAAYLPIHVLPLLVAVIVYEQRASLSQAGWMATAYMTGQLLAAVGLPAMRARRVGRWWAFLGSAMLLSGLVSSAHLTGMALVAGWFLIGSASGALYYLGTVFIARSRDPAFGFSLRLSVSLSVAGICLLAAQIFTGSASYLALIRGLCIALTVFLVLGLGLFGSEAGMSGDTRRTAERSNSAVPLVILYFLFAGQIGYWAFALHSSSHLEMPREQALVAIAGCKVFGALMMLPLSYRDRKQSISTGFLLPGSVLITGILAAVSATEIVWFFCGLLLWEIGFNVLSARLQTRAVHINPLQSGSWITAAIFLGAATGPAIQGHATAHGLDGAFIVFAIGCALLPFCWEQFFQRPASSISRALRVVRRL